ncbi:hypothetical protein JWJ90_13200 [Desulfobulbus rhabdoformis]|uniref:hypothetical protein n=1 Tax=Desulfobulbus rhabdoformis TaxID=34032 RepID=UPI001965C095|nr:hypothetical protein [Desulfobulbus rhabdoformis]MBM9615237.1 hypothetical protein [Desulfobulbus rhabdoformis]
MDQKTDEKINELANFFCSSLKIEAQKLARSGMIDVGKFDPDQFALAKVLLTASIKRMQDDFAPVHDKKLQADVENLLHA